MRLLKQRRLAFARILGGLLIGALVGGLIGMSTGDATLLWVWLVVSAALGAVIAAAPIITDAPITR